ncbi:MAG: quinolinate synthase NadA [Candidatus Thermoplasmatota archaeon]|nr:quinolinate synthase NadA [Candidatus Thermoplasmatota archaeon]MBS3790551.1 quinolinate synthase NadA [Candidatus Thermoplasmatota archaeon]
MSTQREIKRLKGEKDIVIVAHNYQMGDIQDIADFVGDSFGLAQKVNELEVSNVVFCGVDFMAESAAILNPDKRVILPDLKAECPMAEMVDIGDLRSYKEKNPEAAVVSYVNTNAETKAESDICCTSSNAVKVVKSLDNEKVLFLPDKNLGNYIKRFVHDKQVEVWEGYCATHDNILPEEVRRSMEEHPEAEVVVHPECRPEVVDIADYVESTAGILERAKKTASDEMIIGTEKEMGYRLEKEVPDKEYYFPGNPTCQNMKKITPEKVLNSLKSLSPKVKVEEDIAERARRPLQKMVDLGRGK